MLNKIWFWLLCIGILYGFGKSVYQTAYPPAAQPTAASQSNEKTATDKTPSNPAPPPDGAIVATGKRLNDALVNAAKSSVEICIGLIGIMCIWLGLMNVAKDAGLIDAFARAMRPVLRLLFPDVPDGHPAQGAMLMNISANMLGTDNAATPLGLKAMEELQSLNPVKDTATNSMATFLAINCGSVTLIPISIIAFRALRGSTNPAGILLGVWIASFASVVAGITAARVLARMYPPVAAEGIPTDAASPASFNQ